jgi:hypothetical protein
MPDPKEYEGRTRDIQVIGYGYCDFCGKCLDAPMVDWSNWGCVEHVFCPNGRCR